MNKYCTLMANRAKGYLLLPLLLSLPVIFLCGNMTALAVSPMATNLSAAETYTEDTTLDLIDIVLVDVDSVSVTATLTLSTPAAGSLTTATSGAVTSTYNAGTGVWTASGLIANVNILLAGVSYVPTSNYNSNFTITTNVTDGVDAPVSGSKAFTGVAVNDAPSATNLSAAESYTEDTTLNLTDIVVTDVDSLVTATLTLSTTSAGSLTTATSGAVTSTFSSGVWSAGGAVSDVNTLLAGVSFVPASNYNSNFTIATSVTDGVAAAVTGTKAFTGVAVNDAPVLDSSKSPSLGSVSVNGAVPTGVVGIPVSNLIDFDTPAGGLDNVSDIDSGALLGIAIVGVDSDLTCYYTLDSGDTWSTLGTPSTTSARLLTNAGTDRIYCLSAIAGTYSSALTLQAWDQTTGVHGSTANASVNGGTTAFSSASDGVQLSVTASSNTAPVASDDEYAMLEDAVITEFAVLENDTDDDDDELTVTAVTEASHGVAEISEDETGVNYTPSEDYCGLDTFDYTISDNTDTDEGTVVVTIICVNDPPTATNMSASQEYLEDTTLDITVIEITDVDSEEVTANLTLSDPDAGSLSTSTSGAVTSTYNEETGEWEAAGLLDDVNILLDGLTFVPTTDYVSAFTIATSVDDGDAPAITGTKTMSLSAGNTAPEASDDEYTMLEDAVTTEFAVLVNDTDDDDDELTVTAVTEASHGVAEISEDETGVNYTPSEDYCGLDTFDYTVSDGTDSDDAEVTITIICVDDLPGVGTDLNAEAISTARVYLTWTAPVYVGDAAIIGYKIERESPSDDGFSILVANSGSTSTIYTDIGLSPSTTYRYKVSAISALGVGNPSSAVSVTTKSLSIGSSGGNSNGTPSSPDHWSQEYIDKLKQKCLLDQQGIESIELKSPDVEITRAELVSILILCEQLSHSTTEIQPFTDVKGDEWFAPFLVEAKNQGWVQGYIDGSFIPNGKITRAESSKVMLLSQFEDSEIPNEIPDFLDTLNLEPLENPWYYKYIAKASKLGLVSGYKNAEGTPTGFFGPNDFLTQGQAAKILSNMLGF